MCCVIPPASLACTLVLRILSRSRVLPVSTWPSTHTMGWRVGILGCFLLFISEFCVGGNVGFGL